ncbi:MAG: Gfo/Idh/MocA family oxidoreductase [Candidatus Latescibacteria bacterium]|nr:Gfo/Idh/MocA family oxidoreductase [Candidatus Latescibacterota bacterium]
MSADTVGFGVIGLGMGASRAELIHQMAGARLVAVADIDPARGQKAAAKYGIEWYDDYRRLLDRTDIDAIMVMTPSGTHADFVIAAAQAGKHAISTKPIEVTLERADTMIAACKQAGVILAVDFESRYVADNVRLRQAIQEGRLGKLILGEARLKWYRSDAYYEGWHGTWKLDGGGSLINQTVHQIDLLVWLMGPPKTVWGQIGVFTHKIETEDLGMAMIAFQNGAVGTILGTTTCPHDFPPRMEIHGDRGVVMTASNKIEVWQIPGESESDPFPYDGPKNVIEDIVRVVREGGTPRIDGAEAKRSLQLVRAVYDSAQTGRPVTVA